MESSLANACKIRIKDFEGPFDLLFHLIEKNKVNIYDIPINDIVGQYLHYLSEMRELNLDIASEFLVMAATLLYIKSRMLLPGNDPTEDEGPDPREELVNRLLEYRKYKEVTDTFRKLESLWLGSYCRVSGDEPSAAPGNDGTLSLSIDKLAETYRFIILRNEKRINRNLPEITDFVRRETMTLRQKMNQILKFLAQKGAFIFSEFLSPLRHSRSEVVSGFLAMLELSRLKKVILEQKKLFSSILIKSNTKLK